MAADTSTESASFSFSVDRWLKAVCLSEYTTAFTISGHVSYRSCISLSEEDVRAVGVKNNHHVRLLMMRAKELRKLSEEDAVKLLWSQNMSLCLACDDGDVKLAEQLITSGANVNWCNPLNAEITPVWIAARHGNVDLLNMLIDAGGDVNIANVYKQTPVWVAACNGDVGALNVLIRAKADVNAAEVSKQTPVWIAAFYGHVGALNVLIRAKADVNTANVDKTTPVFIAAQNGHVEALSVLISASADFNAANKDKTTPVYVAAQNGHVESLAVLISAGADVNAARKDKRTPAYIAARNGHIGALKALISAGAKFNAANVTQDTPAHIAAYRGHVDILRLLHQHNATLDTKDKWNRTPLDAAVRMNHSSVVEFLKTIGEEQHTPDPTISEDTTPDFSVDDDTAHEVLQQEVGVSTADLMLAGSPGSGKTSVMHLSLNEPPPDVRHSTGCVETPVRAIASGIIYADGTMMKKLETEEMLDMLCGALRHAIEKDIRRQHEEHMNTVIHHPVSSTATPTPTQASLEESPRQDVAAPPKADNAAKQQVSTPQTPATTEEEKLKVFAKLMKEVSSVKASPNFLTATLVSTTDSGGQPQFMDACSLLLRSNSLFMITVKLNERLDEKPKFEFFINGKPISMCSTSLQLTNLQLIESIAKTVSSIQLSTANTTVDGSQPRQAKFMLVGTFADKAHECEGETIADKNRILKERLKHFKAELVDNSGDVIFPVNAVTTNLEERQKAALRLQEIITNTPGTSFKANIKLRWFGLLVHMLDVAKKKGVSILRLGEIIAAGKCLMMSEKETRQAVKHFHDMNLISHHSTEKLDQLVFVSEKPILNQLTNLLGVAFIDKRMLDGIFKTKVPINAQELLKDHGLFSQSLLESCFSFPAPLTTELFLNVLEHLSMIARIEKDGQTSFFLPSALPHAPEDFLLKKEQVSITPWILRLKMRRDAVLVNIPIPKGYLPTLVILLITSRKFEADLDDCGRQYRNVMSILYVDGGHVYFIERTHQLEIYYSCDKQLPNHCSIIRSEIVKALIEAEKKLRFKPNILTKEDVFICSCNGPHPRHFCKYKSTSEIAICEKTRSPRYLSKQQQCWILPPSQVDRVGVSSPPTAATGSPCSQATPGSPVTSSVSSTTAAAAAAATPFTAIQHNKVDRIGANPSSPPTTALTGSPHSHGTPSSPVTSCESSTTTPPTADQAAAEATSPSEQPTSHSQSVARAQIGSKPTLPHILAFPFKTGVDSIVKKIAGSRNVFGVLLLEDNDGSIISGIAASSQSPSEITLAIVCHWIQGNGRQPISWDTFIDTVRKAGLVTLADDIREGLGNLQ